MIKTVGIISNPKNDNVKSMLHSVITFFKSRGVQVLLNERSAELADGMACAPDDVIYKQADLMVALGGDGTVIAAARLAGDRETPVLGIHMGRLGFITDVSPGEAVPATLDKVMAGALPIRNCMRLECEVVSAEGETIFKANALNEIALAKGAIARIIEFNVSVNGNIVDNYRADGYIVSTPIGSTGYSLSAGGPLVLPDMSLMILSTICAHSLIDRSLVIPAESVVKIEVQGGRQDIAVTYDGQVGKELSPGDSLVIKRTAFDSRLYHVPGKSFFEHLKSKFGWGQY